MAISRNAGNPPIYYGLSTDVKPVAGIVAGAWFIETDTNTRYEWTGDQLGTTSQWVEAITATRKETRDPGDNVTLDAKDVFSGAQVAQVTADTGIKTGSGYLLGFVCIATTSGTFLAYDNTSAAGTIIYPLTTPTVGQIITLPAARPFSTGLFIDVSNTLTLDVYYRAAP